jgi:O-antigen/teichoic acid export membrane protein
MTGASQEPSVPTIGRRSFVGVGAASLFSAAVGFAVLLIVPKVLGDDRAGVEATTVFISFWSFLFAFFGILGGLSAETTRAVHVSDRSPVAPAERREPRMLLVGLGVGVALGVALWATSLWWAPRVLTEEYAYLAVPLSCSIALFSGHATIVGILGGRLQWNTFARLVIGDSLLRLALVVTAAVVAAFVGGFALAASVSSVTWLIGLLFSPTLRQAARARADTPLGPFLARVGHACLASGSSAVLVVGFPVVLALTSSPAVYAAAAPLLLAITFTRAPLLIPLNAYQGVAIAHFVNNRSAGLRALWPVARIVIAIAAVGAVLGGLLGPLLLVLVYGEAYAVNGWVIAGLVVAAGMLALVTLTGAVCLAVDRHRAYSTGWISATVLAVLILLLPLPIDLRAVLALLIGPLAGLAIHYVALRRAAREPAAATAPVPTEPAGENG